ncbi:MAG: AarF/UbiB family protein [Hymenobacter sp.]
MAETGMDIYLTQIFEFGFFHADPHPGNVLVRPDGTLVLIDFGMVGKLTKQQKYAFAGVFIGMARQDARSMALNFRRLALSGDIPDMRAFESRPEPAHRRLRGARREGHEHGRPGRLAARHHLPLQIAGAGRGVPHPAGAGYPRRHRQGAAPQLQYLRVCAALRGAEIVKEQYSPENILNEAEYTGTQLLALLQTLPADLRQIVRKISKGELRVKVELSGYNTAAAQGRPAR